MMRAVRALALVLCAVCIMQMLLLPLCPAVLADGGMIGLSDVLVYGPGQNAIIAWDGEREILILSINVYAESETTALHVVPLPAEPDSIEQGDFKSFEHLAGLLQERLASREPWFDCSHHFEGDGDSGVDIVFHEKIGAHDIWVSRATDAAELIEWADYFLAQNKIQHQVSSPELEEVAAEYIDEGIEHFVFDLIDLGPEQESVEPIVYQFRSDTLYYPLKISSIIPGNSAISLFLLTPDCLADVEGLPESYWHSESGRWEPVAVRLAQQDDLPVQFELGRGDLESVDQRVADLLGDHAWLSLLQSFRGGYVDIGSRNFVPLAALEEDVSISRTSFVQRSEHGGTAVWVWVLVGLAGALVALSMVMLLYVNIGSRRKAHR